MNGEIYQVSFSQFDAMIGDCAGKEIILSAAKLASDIIVGMYGEVPVAYIGLVPPTLLADEAFVWMITTEEGNRRPILLARYGKKTIATILLKFPKLYGFCFNPKSAKWLKSLGAEFTSETKFEIRRG
jgi:hypothetical protein